MGHKVNKMRATKDFSTSPLSSPSSASEGLPQTNMPASHPWSLFVDSPQDIVRRILCMLPSQAQIQLLVQFYVSIHVAFLELGLIIRQVQHVDWYAKVGSECFR
jgi:hypothetical protein